MSATPMSVSPTSAGPSDTTAFIELVWSSKRPELRDEKEDWKGVTNPVERRKLQNRLNQRTRRSRAQKKEPRGAVAPDELPKGLGSLRGASRSASGSSSDCPSELNTVVKTQCIGSSPRVQELMLRFSEHAYASYMQGKPALSHLPLLLKYNVSSGLARNADILGVTEQYYDWYGISPLNKQGPLLGTSAAIEWPACLHPTKLQSSMEHHPWLDLFPWPTVRDNMLQAFQYSELDYEDELCDDICEYNDLDTRPNLIVWGASEDYRNWEIGPVFLEKWGWLLSGCVEVLETTNYWRVRRGEKMLSLQEWRTAIRRSIPTQLAEL